MSARAHGLEEVLPESSQRIESVGDGCAAAENNHGHKKASSRSAAGKEDWNDEGDGEQAVGDAEMFRKGGGGVGRKQQINNKKQNALRKLDAEPQARETPEILRPVHA